MPGEGAADFGFFVARLTHTRRRTQSERKAGVDGMPGIESARRGVRCPLWSLV